MNEKSQPVPIAGKNAKAMPVGDTDARPAPGRRSRRRLRGPMTTESRPRGGGMRRLAGCALLVAASTACGDGAQGVAPRPAPGDGSDFTIRYVERLPRIDYVENGSDPKTQGWPRADQRVTWTARVRNWSSAPRSVAYRWLLDGSEVKSGIAQVPGDGEAAVELPLPWSFTRRLVGFELDPANEVLEETDGNNRVEVFTDALAIGLYVERSLYDFFRANQHRLEGVHSTSFEDWAHRHVRRFNEMLAAARYPESPDGVRDRVRLDRVVVVPDGTVRDPTGPYFSDRSSDMTWPFPATSLRVYDVPPPFDVGMVAEFNPNYYEGSLLHELGHARGLVDVYAFALNHGILGNHVDIREGNVLAVESGLMPAERTTVFLPDGSRQAYYRLFRTPDQGLMNTDYTRIDRYSAAALNLIAGWRSWRGNKNPSPNVPAELVRPPRENRLTVRDAATGVPLAGAEVRVFQGDPDHYLRPGVEDPYGKHVDAVADLTLTADAAGRVLLGENPFDRAMRLTGSNAVAVVRVAQEGRVGYGYLEWRAFVLAYWRGERELADHELRVDMRRQAAGDAVSRPRP